MLLLAVGVAAPVITSVIVFFGFVTNYTHQAFSIPELHAQYDEGIYRYRVLGKLLLEAVQQWFVENPSVAWIVLDTPFGYPVAKLETTADPKTYAAYFVLNTLFMVLFCSTSYLVLRSRAYVLAPVDAATRALFLMLTAQVALYAVTFYDTPLYFLTALAWGFVLRFERQAPWLLVPLVIVGTLFRETSLLIVAMYAALLAAQGTRWREWLRRLVPAGVAFAATYVGLRQWFGWETGILQEVAENSSEAGFAALFCFGFAAPVLLSGGRRYARFVAWTLLFSAPYLYAVARGGILTEVRLFVPLLIIFYLAAGVRALTEPTDADSSPR